MERWWFAHAPRSSLFAGVRSAAGTFAKGKKVPTYFAREIVVCSAPPLPLLFASMKRLWFAQCSAAPAAFAKVHCFAVAQAGLAC